MTSIPSDDVRIRSIGPPCEEFLASAMKAYENHRDLVASVTNQSGSAGVPPAVIGLPQ